MSAEPERSLLPVDMDVTPDTPRDQPTVDDDGELLDTGLDGVELARVSPHVDDRGSLIEIYNPSLKFWREPVVYTYGVLIRPGRIKGWGMHKLQSDRYLILSGRLRVVLYDGRTASPTYQRFAEFQFTDETPGLLYIPPGVWHADQNTGDEDVVMINFPTRAYDHDRPDKYRIDRSGGEIPFDWTLKDY